MSKSQELLNKSANPEIAAILKKYLFSSCARRIIAERAPKIARKHGSDRIEPLHILLALTEEKGTSGEAALHHQGSSLNQLRKAAKAEQERQTFEVPEAKLPYSPESYELLRLAHNETDAKNIIQTVHLLLGILHLDEDDPAYHVLHRQGVHVVRTRRLIAIR